MIVCDSVDCQGETTTNLNVSGFGRDFLCCNECKYRHLDYWMGVQNSVVTVKRF